MTPLIPIRSMTLGVADGGDETLARGFFFERCINHIHLCRGDSHTCRNMSLYRIWCFVYWSRWKASSVMQEWKIHFRRRVHLWISKSAFYTSDKWRLAPASWIRGNAGAGVATSRIIVLFSLVRLKRPSAHAVSSAQRGLAVWLREQEDRLERWGEQAHWDVLLIKHKMGESPWTWGWIMD